jgi:putative ABC transport system ATP-binding protein
MSLLLNGVRKSYREPDGRPLPILNVPRFEIAAGEQVALVGQSGGGKTTLLNVIAGITTADAGSVVVDGVDVTRLPEAARDRFRAERIGIVFQTFNLLSGFTAIENVLLGMTFAGRANRAFARDLLSRVGLEHRLSHKPGQLSVGEQQRVAVARALANRPKLMLADEPTANVDVGNQDLVLNLIRDACTEQGVSLLLVTHAPEVAQRFGRVEHLAEFNRPGASA